MDEDEDDLETNETVGLPSWAEHTNRTLIYNMYQKLSQFEHHFDLITTKYKYMALTWLLATFAGIGFLLSRDIQNLPFSPLKGVIVICLIGMAGITLIWHLDINIYTKFWAVVFIEEVRMERKFKFLLRSRNIELLIDEDRERIVAQGFLYMIANIVLLLTIGVVFAYFVLNQSMLYFVVLGILFVIISFIICWTMYRVAKRTQRTFINAIRKIEK
jgi:hypothetical protein